MLRFAPVRPGPAIIPAMLLAIDVGNTQTPPRGLRRRRARRALALSHRRRRDRATSSPSGSPACSRSAALEPAEVEAIVVSSVVPQLGGRVRGDGERYFEAPQPDGRARGQDRDADPDRQPARGRRRPARQRGRRLRADRRRLRRRSTSAPAINFDVVSAEGEYLGGVIAPRGRDLAGRRWPSAAARSRGSSSRRRRRRSARRPAAHPVGIIYGFAGLIDGIVRRIEARAGRRADAARHRRPGARDRPVLRDDRRGGRSAHADRAAPDLGAQR